MTGKQMAAIMDALDLSQVHISEATGYSRSAVNMWILRDKEFDTSLRLRLCNYFVSVIKARQEKENTVLEILSLMA